MTDRIAHLRPSGAHRWSKCHGFPALAAGLPPSTEESDNEAAEDGTACHWLGAEVWEGRTPAVGSLSPNGREITDDMYDAVDLYHAQLRTPCSEGMRWWIEQSVSCATIYPGIIGTPDAAGYKPGHLKVVDLKYGFSYVEVFDNDQLIVYAVSKAAELQLPPGTLVELVIVQPRSFHRDGPVRTWTTTLAQLQAHVDRLRAAAVAAMGPAPLCTVGEWCRECPARYRCVALQAAAYGAMERAYSATPLQLESAALAMELRHLDEAGKRIEARMNALKAQAEQLMRAGAVLPGWSLEATFARETWQPGMEQQVIAFASLLGANITKPRKAITPNQARKLLPPGTVEAFSHRPSTGVALRRQDPKTVAKRFTNQPE